MEDDPVSVIKQVTEVTGEVTSMAWRSTLRGPQGLWGLRSHAFLLTNLSHKLHQDVSYSTMFGVHSTEKLESEEFGLLVVATKEKLYFFDGDSWWFEWVSNKDVGRDGVIDGPPTALTFTASGDLYIATNLSISILHNNYTFSRLGPLEGLPYRPVTSLHYSRFVPKYPPATEKPPESPRPEGHGGVVWVGTEKGFALLNSQSTQFISYHYGPRWHPGDRVRSIVQAARDSTVVLTDKGLSVMRPENWTLRKKASYYQTVLKRHQKHRRPPGENYFMYCRHI